MNKRKFPFLFVVCFLLIKFSPAQIISNGGFENWVIDSTGYLNPTGWFTSNGEETSTATVVQAPGRTGNYSAKLVSVDTGNGFAGGSLFFLYFGSIRPHILSGYWKGTYSTSDGIIAGVTTVNSTFDVIAGGNISSSVSHSGWVAFTDTVDSLFPGSAVETWVQIILSTNSAGAVGYVDDLSLTYTTDIGEIKTMNLLSSSLAHDSQTGNYLLNFDLLMPCPLEISVYSADGKKISTTRKQFGNGHYEFPIYVLNVAQGIYFCRIIGDGVNKVYKMVK